MEAMSEINEKYKTSNIQVYTIKYIQFYININTWNNSQTKSEKYKIVFFVDTVNMSNS